MRKIKIDYNNFAVISHTFKFYFLRHTFVSVERKHLVLQKSIFLLSQISLLVGKCNKTILVLKPKWVAFNFILYLNISTRLKYKIGSDGQLDFHINTFSAYFRMFYVFQNFTTNKFGKRSSKWKHKTLALCCYDLLVEELLLSVNFLPHKAF